MIRIKAQAEEANSLGLYPTNVFALGGNKGGAKWANKSHKRRGNPMWLSVHGHGFIVPQKSSVCLETTF